MSQEHEDIKYQEHWYYMNDCLITSSQSQVLSVILAGFGHDESSKYDEIADEIAHQCCYTVESIHT